MPTKIRDSWMWRRTVTALALAGVSLGASVLGLSEVYSAAAIVAGLETTGFSSIQVLSPTTFRAGHHTYEIWFICTPTVLSLCGFALLWFARQTPWRYLWTSVGFTVLSGILICATVMLSIHLCERGVDWVWAHFPATILVYAGSLSTCLVFAEIRQQRVLRAPSEREETRGLGKRASGVFRTDRRARRSGCAHAE